MLLLLLGLVMMLVEVVLGAVMVLERLVLMKMLVVCELVLMDLVVVLGVWVDLLGLVWIKFLILMKRL